MEGMNQILYGINALGAMEHRQKQSALADMQMQQVQRDNAEKAAVSAKYNTMAEAFKQSGGDINALAPLVQDKDSMKAFAAFAQDYQSTQDGLKKGQEASAQRAMVNFQQASGFIEKALSSQKGSEEWVANVQNAAAAAPIPMKVANYDPQTDTFEAMEANPVAGFQSTGQRIPAGEITGTLARIKQGTMKGKDGTLFNPEFQRAQIMFDLGRKTENPRMLADEKSHIVLQKGGQTVTAVPQLSENPADGYNYLVVEPGKGISTVKDLQPFIQSGWTMTTQEQMNKERDFGFKEQQLGMEQQRIGVSMANLGESRRQHEYQRTRDARLEDNDALRAANSVIDDIRSRQSQILKNYVEPPQLGPDATPEEWQAAMLGAKKAGMDIMRQRAQSGDTTAKADLEALGQMDQTYNEFSSAREQKARRMVGLGMAPAKPQEPAATKQEQPPQQAQKQIPQGAVRDAGGQVYVPAKEGEPGAKRAKNGNWYKPYQQ